MNQPSAIVGTSPAPPKNVVPFRIRSGVSSFALVLRLGFSNETAIRSAERLILPEVRSRSLRSGSGPWSGSPIGTRSRRRRSPRPPMRSRPKLYQVPAPASQTPPSSSPPRHGTMPACKRMGRRTHSPEPPERVTVPATSWHLLTPIPSFFRKRRCEPSNSRAS